MELIVKKLQETPSSKAEQILICCLHECAIWKGDEPEYIQWLEKQKVDIKDCFNKMNKDELKQFLKDKIYLVKNIFHTGIFEGIKI